MTKDKKGQKNKKKSVLKKCLLPLMVLVAVLLIDACEKKLVTVENSQNQIIVNEQGKLLLENEEGLKGQLRIPLEADVSADRITLENHYQDKELWIYIPTSNSSHYSTNAIEGDITEIEDGCYEARESQIILKFAMKSIWEHQSTVENGSLQITMLHPNEVYEQIVVVDPVGGGSEWGITEDGYSEKELTCQVARLLEGKIKESGIKLYFTRPRDVEVSTEERLQLVQDVDADLYLRLGVSQAEDAEVYGIQTFYNEEYVIPEFGNVQWADLVTKKVTTLANNKALGLLPADEDSFLQSLKIPAAQIQLGFMSNPQECLLMQQEGYQEKLAQGIAEAILEVYTNKNNLNQQAEKNEK